MPYIIAEPCIGLKDRSCVDVCPVDCIYEGEDQLYIHPDECIDCGACEPECPVTAIFPEEDTPPQWKSYIAKNRDVFQGDIGLPLRRRVFLRENRDRKSTRLNSSHDQISYAVFCLKKKTHNSTAENLLKLSTVQRNKAIKRLSEAATSPLLIGGASARPFPVRTPPFTPLPLFGAPR